jgi:hypothetical protein
MVRLVMVRLPLHDLAPRRLPAYASGVRASCECFNMFGSRGLGHHQLLCNLAVASPKRDESR